MNISEEKMISALIDLRKNYGVVGIKAEFGEEATSYEEALKLKEIALGAGLGLTIKIGGCEAVKDIFDAKKAGAETIIAPMIESSYALKKYTHAIDTVFSDSDNDGTKFLINIETKCGFDNLDEIFESADFEKIDGIVMGRTDLAYSLGISLNDVNSNIIYNYAEILAEKLLKYNKELIIGGSIDVASIPFIKKVPAGVLKRFETRKIIFDTRQFLLNKNAELGIINALNFELDWLKYKQSINSINSDADEKRIKLLETRCNILQNL